jgi:hypothetical protein
MNVINENQSQKSQDELSLEDTATERQRGVAPTKRDGQVGYNPYDAPPAVPTVQTRRPKDLRKLSEWIRLQKQVEELKKEAVDPVAPVDTAAITQPLKKP